MQLATTTRIALIMMREVEHSNRRLKKHSLNAKMVTNNGNFWSRPDRSGFRRRSGKSVARVGRMHDRLLFWTVELERCPYGNVSLNKTCSLRTVSVASTPRKCLQVGLSRTLRPGGRFGDCQWGVRSVDVAYRQVTSLGHQVRMKYYRDGLAETSFVRNSEEGEGKRFEPGGVYAQGSSSISWWTWTNHT